MEGIASGSRHVLSLTPSMVAQRVMNNESEELLMMFSTSPESPKPVHAARHSSDPVWTRFDDHDEHARLSTGMTNKTRDYTRSTAAEISGLSYNSYATPMSELFNNSSSSYSYRLGDRGISRYPNEARAAEADPASPAPSTPIFEFSTPIERTQAISFTTQSNTRISNTSHQGPVRSLDSTFSYDSYATGITSPSISFDEDAPFPASPEEQPASTSLTAKEKGKATQIDELLSSRPFSEEAQGTLPLASPFIRQSFVTRSHDVLGHYSPDVADLMPQFELERKAFDWGEFERSICSSPGAGTSFASPFSPIDSMTSSLGLTLSPPMASPVELVDAQGSQTDTQKFPSPETTEVTSEPMVDEGREAIENLNSSSSSVSPVAESSVARVPSNRARKHAVSMYETSAPDSNRRSVSYRTGVVDHDTRHNRARTGSTATSIISRPYSAGPSPRLKRRSLTLPSWLSKGKEGNGSQTPEGIVDHSRANLSPLSTGKDTLHRPRKLHKEKGRSQTTPVTFPFVITQEGIVPNPVTETEGMPEAVDTSVKPVEEVSHFETMLPREVRLFVLAQLVVVHQEEFELRLKEGRWSVAHASRERWVGKDAGMRELVKLSRVSTSWQSLALDGQLWQSFNLKAFPGLSTSLVLRLAQYAGAFVQRLNLQGHSLLKPSSILTISSSISFTEGSSLSTTQLTTINLVACTSITTHSLHFLLYRSPRLQHLLVRGLDSVTNTTLTEILGPYCPNVISLDIRRCSNTNGSGLEAFAEQCIARASHSNTACSLTSVKVAGMKGISVEVWRKVGQAFPLLEILDCSYCRDLTDECFREFVAWPTPTGDVVPGPWSVFSSGIELSSREAGFDPGDPTKHWRRLTSLRHLNVSGCRQITDLTCSSLAFTMPKLEILEIAGVRGDLHDDGLIRLFKTTPLIRKVDLEDATEISDAVVDSLIPEPRMASPIGGQQESKEEQGPQPGERLEHLTISYAMTVTPDAMARIIRGCKKLRVLEADNTRITGSIIRDFVSRRRHREKGLTLPEGGGSEIVGIDCRAVSEGAVKEMRGSTRPRRGWRGWEARDLGYEDSQSTGTMDATGAVIGTPIGQDECDERRVVVKSFHSWVTVDNVAEQRAKLKNANGGAKAGNAELPRWLTQWSLGRRTPTHSTQGTPEEREDRGCVVQ